MTDRMSLIGCLLLVALVSALAAPAAMADEALDKALETLKAYDWGNDRGALKPIDDAVAASHGDKAVQKDLEGKLAALLDSDAPQAAKDFACRKLSLIGSAGCVPTVAKLLTDEKLSHMARYALERIPDEAAVAAMRDSLAKVKGRQKVGVVNSLGVRRDAKSTATFVKMLSDSDKELVGAAVAALGSIGDTEAAKALAAFQAKAPKELKLAAADAYLACAEQLLKDKKKADAMAIYKALSKSETKHIKLAAMRGLLAVTKSK